MGDEDQAVEQPAEATDGGWPGRGESQLRWLLAEALVAYHVWQYADVTHTVQWDNWPVFDVLVTRPDGSCQRFDAKRAWRVGTGEVGFGGPPDPDGDSVDFLALVLLEDVSAEWARQPDGGVRVTATAPPADVFLVPVDVVREWATGERPRVRLPLDRIEQFRVSTQLPGGEAPAPPAAVDRPS